MNAKVSKNVRQLCTVPDKMIMTTATTTTALKDEEKASEKVVAKDFSQSFPVGYDCLQEDDMSKAALLVKICHENLFTSLAQQRDSLSLKLSQATATMALEMDEAAGILQEEERAYTALLKRGDSAVQIWIKISKLASSPYTPK
jgi:hypothetical protein